MELFFQLFHPQVPHWIVFADGVVCLFCVLLVMLCKSIRNKRRWIAGLLTVGYLFIILYTTVLGREAKANYEYCLTPFWSIGSIEEGFIETFYEKIFNVMLFMPLGVLGWFGLNKDCKKGYSDILKVICFGALTSIAIELLQLVTRTGMCETDDVICNTIGCLIGYEVVWIFYIQILKRW